MKEIIMGVLGIIGGLLCNLFGCWDRFLEALIIFMAIDYFSGLIIAYLGNSIKSVSGKLRSSVMLKGLFKKGMMLLFVIIGNKLDSVIGANYIKSAVIFAFLINELLSIIENAGLLGVPIPEVLKQAIEVLNHRVDKADKQKGTDNGQNS
jgi:toxin secretion/phage lysis holin